MAKTNFTKAEEILAHDLQQITVNHLLELTPKKGDSSPKLEKIHQRLIASLQRELKSLRKKEPEIYTKVGIEKDYLKKLLEKTSPLTEKEAEALKQLDEKVKIFKEELKKLFPEANDEGIVEAERIKHINKRFNVKEKWLPLH
jgi:hypothetical protein